MKAEFLEASAKQNEVSSLGNIVLSILKLIVKFAKRRERNVIFCLQFCNSVLQKRYHFQNIFMAH